MPQTTATGRRILAESQTEVETGLALADALEDWRSYLDGEVTARRKSAATRNIYVAGVERFVRFATEAGMPPTIEGIRREHIEAFMQSLADRAPATADTYRRAVARWFTWLVEDDALDSSPAANVKAIPIPEAPPPLLRAEQLRAILAACKPRGREDFEGYRDTAIVWLLLCGLRRGELAGLKVSDVQRRQRVVIVTGKGNRTRAVPFLSPEVDNALRRYERARDRHHGRGLDSYLLGWKGRLGADGIRQALERRADQAGVPGVHAHLFRHTASHLFRMAGGSEADMMVIFGWRSPAMARRYGASAAAERAAAAVLKMDVYGDL